MASITVRKLEESVKKKLRLRAASNGRSLEEEARVILRTAVRGKSYRTGKDLYDAIRRRIEPLGGVELPEMPPEYVGDPPDFE